MASNEENKLSDDNELMDDERPTIPVEEDQQYSEKSNFLGPVNLFVCKHFIMMSEIIASINDNAGNYLEEVFKIVLSHDTNLDNEITELPAFVDELGINLYICIIDRNDKIFHHLNTSTIQTSQYLHRAYVVFDKSNQKFYPFYVCDMNKKNHTIFSVNDTHILKLFEDSVKGYKWPGEFDTTKQMSDQDIPMVDQGSVSTSHINYNTVNRENQSETILNDSDLCNSVIQYIPHLKSYMAPQFDRLKFSTITSKHQLHNHELMSSTNSLSNTTNNIQQTIKLPKLILLNQPKRFWHHRELATLGDGCPAIQVEGAPQRTPLLLELPEEIKKYQEEFYIGTHVTTYNGNEHKQKLVVPNNTKIKKTHKLKLNNLECLEFDDKQKFSVEFGSISKGVFSKVDSNDLENLQKKLTLIMINLYQDINNNKNIIKEDKLIWCRLMFAIYVKLLPNGQFERVSSPTYSDLIKETHRSHSLDFDSIFPNKFCERGGQMIFIKLLPSIEKDNLYVHCNGKLLSHNDFQVGNGILSFESPVCRQDRENLQITIFNTNARSCITHERPYHLHDDHPDPCGMANED
ncbi:unnamed protein product [Rotaria sordida]|uniref:Uncharacterized protein n=1 Tax=Rotaria sordida TaxID=392033 RepID=A0A819YKL1_9BILA|nr:unnamed protein product [Rotaria sordida]